MSVLFFSFFVLFHTMCICVLLVHFPGIFLSLSSTNECSPWHFKLSGNAVSFQATFAASQSVAIRYFLFYFISMCLLSCEILKIIK